MSDITERLKDALADGYAVERELGAGGMATVYLAEDLKHERKVAISMAAPLSAGGPGCAHAPSPGPPDSPAPS